MAAEHTAKSSHRNVIDLAKAWPYSARIFWRFSGMRRLRRMKRERATI
ncbi:hypothetical protein EIB18_02065 [Caulobacter vibrioides]|uniref:Uncharacterized protein n=2 Tax=Caulobacter vibrioides TaxID=155892 RepID=Q9AB30_CAUVC|nr:hypothetical protein CC_0404 [Caulobacter vibrioides CB15]ATC23407.1 hypothetical protein CA608_02070 [Caulobacter vibrioides]ATC27235.1 hypothetical protein CA607_02080 [Caulobacter vibrioides]AZH11617.1 hypothetical protein EIB18_02065 [Caulobacter vibrioides]PLR11321.1 hypothetical protein CVUC_11530 [Caulobacter vibrioides]